MPIIIESDSDLPFIEIRLDDEINLEISEADPIVAEVEIATAVISGGGIIDTGSYGSPQSVSTNISVPSHKRSRIYVKGNGGPVVAPTISDGSLTEELYIFGVDDTNYVELQSGSNLSLSGAIAMKNGTMLSLQWIPSLSSWVEVSRNEI